MFCQTKQASEDYDQIAHMCRVIPFTDDHLGRKFTGKD